MAGVPVELNVATIFCAILALLPIPVTITLPFDFKISSTALIKSSVTELLKFLIDFHSFSMVDNAAWRIFSLDSNIFYLK